MNPTSSSILILVLTLALGATVRTTRAQTSTTATCASKLVPCGAYLNGTTPSSDCCSSIKDAVANDRVCLCNLYNTPGLLQSLGVNITQALQLTKECGASTDTSLCKGLAPSPEGSTTPATPAAVPGNDATTYKAAWRGMLTFLMVLASALIH